MALYQIKLTPVDTFFFGGEKHDSNEKANYFVESNCYPQQTTILGFLRYLLLIKNDLIGTNKIKTEGEPIIGNESFDYNNHDQTFGKIGSISPLYFINNNEIYFPAPLDFEYEMGQVNSNYFLLKKDKKYTAKNDPPNLKLISIKGESLIDLYSLDPGKSIVFPVNQAGNEKAEEGTSKDEKFYKQTSMKMNPGWSYAIKAEISLDLTDEILFLPFGGEKSLFKVEISKSNDKTEFGSKLNNYSRQLPLIYFLSDSFAESEISSLVAFAVNSNVSFRNLRSNVNTENYSALGKNTNGLKRSSRYNLITRGSVLYFENSEKRTEALKILEKKHCSKIGFNYFKLIN